MVDKILAINLTQRVERVERVNRCLKKAMCLQAALTVLVLLKYVPGGTAIAGPPNSGEGKAVSASKFLLLDSKGRKRAELGSDPVLRGEPESPTLQMFDEQGNPRIVLTISHGESGYLGLWSADRDPVIQLQTFKDQYPSLVMTGAKDSVATLGIGTGGRPELELSGSDKARIGLTLIPTHAALLDIVDNAGKPRVSLTSRWKDTDPTFEFRDATGNQRWHVP